MIEEKVALETGEKLAHIVLQCGDEGESSECIQVHAGQEEPIEGHERLVEEKAALESEGHGNLSGRRLHLGRGRCIPNALSTLNPDVDGASKCLPAKKNQLKAMKTC